MYIRKHVGMVCVCIMVLGAVVFGAAGAKAEERCDLIVTNMLDEEIYAIHVRYSTPYGDPRNSSSRIYLRPGDTIRLGVQGVTLAEAIVVELITKSYEFNDLSGLKPERTLEVEIASEDGRLRLRRDSGDMAEGRERVFLSDDNRANAVDRDFLTDAKTLEDVVQLVTQKTEEAGLVLGELTHFDLEAGAISDHAHALERCPEVIDAWNETHSVEARWTGGWRTTVPGAMSVCGAATGTVGLDKTLFEQGTERGKNVFFPVFWMEWYGVGSAQNVDESEPEQGIGIRLRFQIPEGGANAMLDALMSDLRVDGYRPLFFQLERAVEDGREDNDLWFIEGEGDKFDDQDAMQEQLFAAYGDGTLRGAKAAWVRTEAFDMAKSGAQPPAMPGVLLLFTKGVYEATFIPDASMLMP